MRFHIFNWFIGCVATQDRIARKSLLKSKLLTYSGFSGFLLPITTRLLIEPIIDKAIAR